MTPEQQKQFTEAVEAGDYIRVVTLGLQIAAILARNGDQNTAMEIRRRIDSEQRREVLEEKWREQRLNIAVDLIPFGEDPLNCDLYLRQAEELMRRNKALEVRM